jgi:DNA-binding response OmpR family regulator
LTGELHRISTRALLEVLPEQWFRGLYHATPMPKRAIEDVILDVLRARLGLWISAPELVEYIYGDDEDGGPIAARSIIETRVFYLRRKGNRIRSHWGRGYRIDEAA